MKTKLLLSFSLLFTASVMAAPLTETTAVHTKPNVASPIISYLKAGSVPTASADATAANAAGWMGVELPGPFEGYVQNKDLTKGLEVKPGASIHIAPKPEAGILAVAEKGDKATLTGLQGKWTQISLEKKLTGYILVPVALGNVAPNTTAVAAAAAPNRTAPVSPAPIAPVAYGTTAAGQAAPVMGLGDAGGTSLPRQFAGKFVSTRRPLTPRRPYDWALNDDAGQRYAYLDVSKLLLTEQIEKYIDHAVVVYGAARNAPGTKDLVIEIESLQLR